MILPYGPSQPPFPIVRPAENNSEQNGAFQVGCVRFQTCNVSDWAALKGYVLIPNLWDIESLGHHPRYLLVLVRDKRKCLLCTAVYAGFTWFYDSGNSGGLRLNPGLNMQLEDSLPTPVYVMLWDEKAFQQRERTFLARTPLITFACSDSLFGTMSHFNLPGLHSSVFHLLFHLGTHIKE